MFNLSLSIFFPVYGNPGYRGSKINDTMRKQPEKYRGKETGLGSSKSLGCERENGTVKLF